MDEGVGAGQQLAVGIVDVHLDQQRARGRVDGAVGARQRAVERLSRDTRRASPCGVAPMWIAGASVSGTATKMRNVSVAVMWNSSVAGLPAPALIRSPTSVLRAVITPSNGA